MTYRSQVAALRKKKQQFAIDAKTEAAKLGISIPDNFLQLTELQIYAGQTSGYDRDLLNASHTVSLYAQNPKKFLSNAVRNAAYNYGYYAQGAGPNDGAYLTAKNKFNIAVTAAAQGGVPIPQIQSAAQAGSSAYSDWLGGPDPLTQVAVIAMPIAMSYALPGIGQSIGQGLLSSGVLAAGTSTATATAIGTAMASIAIQAGQGVPLEDAIKNAGVNAIVQSGSTSAATKLNEIIKNPAVTDALVSAGGSAVKTIAAGGSAEDIKKNIVGAVAGSATASATGSQLAGSTVGGAVTGGVTGALSGAASALGQDAAKPKDTTTTTTETSADPGVKVAGGDDATALNMASISAMPEMLGKAGETASPIYAKTEEGVTFYERTITGTTPDGKPYSYVATYDPTAPAGKQVYYVVGSDATSTATPARPDFSSTGAKGTSGYTPTIITTPSPVVTPTSSPVSADKPILDLIASQPPTTPVTTPTTVGTTTPSKAVDTFSAPSAATTPVSPVTQPTTQPSAAVSEQDKKVLDLISPPSATTTETPAVPSKAPEQVLPEVVATATQEKETTAPITDTKTDTTAPLPVDVAKEELPPEEAPPEETTAKYKPNIFIYGGTTKSTLPQTLGTGATYATSVGTTGLTGERGAGEIESKETGKKRRNVWNEASLRLKDALGV